MPDTEVKETSEEQDVKPKSKKKLVLIAGIAVVVILLSVVGVILLTGGDEVDDNLDETVQTDTVPETTNDAKTDELDSEQITAIYIVLPRPFLFNLQDAGRTRLLQIKVQLMVRSEADEILVKKHIPLIEDALLTTFSNSQATELKTQQGKQQLRVRALKSVNDALSAMSNHAVVEQALFTGFVMQ